MAENKRSRSWIFTINNWTPDNYEALLSLNTSYIIIGKEMGDNGTPHLQGYAYFKNQTYHRTLTNKVPGYWEVALGTPQQNIDYCSKQNDFEEIGTPPLSRDESRRKGGEATKEKWDLALTNARNGNVMDCPADIVIKHYSALNQIAKDNIKPPPDLEDVTGFWLYGEAGCGKSQFARQNWQNAFLKNCNKWWDGYKQEDHVILDDFDKIHHVLGHYLKIWGDRYGFTPEVKCSVTKARPKSVVVTSNYHPNDIWDDNRTLQPILRRFCIIKCWKDEFGYHRSNEGRTMPDGSIKRPFYENALIEENETQNSLFNLLN